MLIINKLLRNNSIINKIYTISLRLLRNLNESMIVLILLILSLTIYNINNTMLSNITEEELEFMQCLHDPVCLIECLFSNVDNLSEFNDKFSHVRLYQLPMISYEYMLDYDNLTTEEQLKLREGAGTVYALAARTIGKTVCVEKLDIPISMMLLDNDIEGFSSFDALHIRGILEDIISAFENHPILQIFDVKVNRSPNYQLRAKNGWFLESINMNIGSKSPGKAFHQKHLDKLYLEEMSYESDEVYKKRAESTKEGGHQVVRGSGMTNFTKQMPCIYEKSKILYPDFTTKDIKDVEEGDIILGFDEKQFKIVKNKVIKKTFSGIKDVIKIKSGEFELYLTPEHKIFTRYGKNLHYYWQEAVKCSFQEQFVFNISYITNFYDYLRGVLIGLIDSDGYRKSLVSKKETSVKTEYHIIQSEIKELESVLGVLDYFKIKYTAREKGDEVRLLKGRLVKRNSPTYDIYISHKNSRFIDNTYKEIFENKDILYGYLAGFILGDGYINNWGDFVITQKPNTEVDLFVKKVADKLNIEYQHWSEGKHRIKAYDIPFFVPYSKKVKDWQEKIANFFKNKEKKFRKVELKGFLEKVKVYDLTTETGNFIANGFIVHNCGRIFYDIENKNKVVNIPSYVSPLFTERSLKKQ